MRGNNNNREAHSENMNFQSQNYSKVKITNYNKSFNNTIKLIYTLTLIQENNESEMVGNSEGVVDKNVNMGINSVAEELAVGEASQYRHSHEEETVSIVRLNDLN